MDTWRLITTWGARPEFNMGLDEALLELASSAPTVRFYSWRPATLSLGYFQRFGDVPAASAARPPVVVRRITGGGAIHHAEELTFSLVAPREHRVFLGTVAESYERVHAAVQSALEEIQVPARPRGAADLVSDREGTGMCFHHSTGLDLAWGGRKGVGSAQRRKGGRVLHHGSIKLGASPLEGEIATAAAHAPGITCEGFAPVLRRALERALEIELAADVPTPEERELAKELGRRYVDPEFVKRR